MAYNKKYAELGESVIDYVNDREDKIEGAFKSFIDSGSDANGSWVKFLDGTMIYYGTIYREISVTGTVGGMFRSNNVSVPAPPASFIGRPLRLFNPVWDSNNTDAVIFGILEQSGSNRVDVYTPISHSLLKINIGFLYIGRWK